jgi:hypothetical protein
MMYIRDRSADSIWPTVFAFLVTMSSYDETHFDGRSSVDVTCDSVGAWDSIARDFHTRIP